MNPKVKSLLFLSCFIVTALIYQSTETSNQDFKHNLLSKQLSEIQLDELEKEDADESLEEIVDKP